VSDQDKNQERPLFEGMDELERIYAPEELPPDDPEQQRAQLDDQSEPPSAAPIGTIGISPSGAMVPVNIGPKDRGASGDSDTEADSSADEGETPDDEP
jgi:hypothetical protein